MVLFSYSEPASLFIFIISVIYLFYSVSLYDEPLCLLCVVFTTQHSLSYFASENSIGIRVRM